MADGFCVALFPQNRAPSRGALSLRNSTYSHTPSCLQVEALKSPQSPKGARRHPEEDPLPLQCYSRPDDVMYGLHAAHGRQAIRRRDADAAAADGPSFRCPPRIFCSAAQAV